MLCMTASRPAQVTQREGETENDGEKGGLAGSRKMEEGERRQKVAERTGGETEEKNRRDEWEKRRGERRKEGEREGGIFRGNQHGGLDRTD